MRNGSLSADSPVGRKGWRVIAEYVELDRPYRSRHSSHVKTAAVTELKNRLSHYLRLVARGESVTILDRGRPVARLTRVEADDAEIEALAASGLARPPLAPLPKDFLTRTLPRPKASVERALLDDRADRF
jgi:prevent-host-death family protein